MNLSERVVLVTGAGGGAGEAIARAFLNAGAAVIAGDLKKPSWNAGSMEEKLIRVEMDVTNQEQVESLVKEINSKTTGIDVVVNNAGVAHEALIQNLELKDWERVFAVNMTGVYICVRAVVKGLLERKQEGRIINISSIAGRNAFPGASSYCASKAAVIGFTRSLAAELGPVDITVNAICPGSVDTGMLQKVIENIAKKIGQHEVEVRMAMKSGIPLKRLQQPEDVAQLALFLASDGGKNINGESINLDGGVVRD